MSKSLKASRVIENFEDVEILEEPLQKSLIKIIEDEDFKSCQVIIRDLNTGGGNFLGKLFEIDIIGETAIGEKEISIFVKQRIDLDKAVLISTKHAYRNEEFVYKELSEIFSALQHEAGIPLHDRYKLPRAYKETSTDSIILENLTKKGFITFDRMDVLPLKYLRMTIEQLAKFNGLSFVIEEKMPEYHDKRIKILEHPLNYDDDWCRLMQRSCKYVANLLSGDAKTKFEKFIPKFLNNYTKRNRDKVTTKCTLTHGDYRSTNILVKECEGEPIEVIVVDYQFLDYGCPMKDLIFAIVANTDKEIRRKHMDEIKELYFETLSRFLRYFDMDVESVYPRRDFEKAYSEWLDYGLMRMLFALPFMFAPKVGVDLGTMTLAELPFSLDENLQERICEMVQDFADWGCLE